MIHLEPAEATAIVSAFVVAALSWFAFLSVGAAANEAGWARRQMRSVAIGSAAVGAVGVVLMLWARPIWVGFAMLYVAGIVWFMARSVRAGLRRVDAIGGADISPGRRRLLLLSTSRWMWLVAAGLVVVTLIDWRWRGVPAVADAVLAAVFATGAWRAGERADRLAIGSD
jgi:hypothetical protein